MSYNGMVGFGVISDYDRLRDLDVFCQGLRDGLAEYAALARRRRRRTVGAGR